MQPDRGFLAAEYAARLQHLYQQMHKNDLDAVLLASEHEIRYYSGFHSQFWHSLTRPWYLLIPRDQQPVAVIPSIGSVGMQNMGVARVVSWSSPNPSDEGVSLLIAEVEKLQKRSGRLGVLLGAESSWRVSLSDIALLQEGLRHWTWCDVAGMVWQQRFVKSEAEIAKIRYIAQTTSQVMHDLPAYLSAGQDEHTVVRLLRGQLLAAGMDNVPFLVGGSGQGGYNDIIMGPTDRLLQDGDVLILDTGTQFDGYFCDFDRNYAIGNVAAESHQAHEHLWQATEQAIQAIRPNMTCSALFKILDDALAPFACGSGGVGRMGHGLGMGLTEWPSIHPEYDVPLPVGAVMTIEPALAFTEGKMLVHEENIVVTEDGAELLSRRTPELML